MEKLLPFFERELGFLRRACHKFAAKYPKLAGNLLLAGEVSTDPHVERLIESVALLNARTAKLIEDDYVHFTEALLSVLYPHYLRPIPAQSIARVDFSGAKPNTINAVTRVPRGSEMKSLSGAKVKCKFKSVYDVTIAPIALSEVRFDTIIQAPSSLRLPDHVESGIRITIESTATGNALAAAQVPDLRVFIDGAASMRTALRDTLFMRAAGIYLETEGSWRLLEKSPFKPVGFADADAVLPFQPSEHAAYRHLSEYFSFPEKFDFFDIDLASLLVLSAPGCKRLSLHLALTGMDINAKHMLKPLSVNNLLLGCTPIVNLFQQGAAPIDVSHTRSSYPLLPNKMPADTCEIYSVDSVQLLRRFGQQSSTTEFVPYYSLRHGTGPSRKGHYWQLRRDEDMAGHSAGHEFSLSLIDHDFTPLQIGSSIASIELTCTNRNLPQALPCGAPGGDLSVECGTAGFPIRMLRQPTRSQRLASGRGAQWGLVSHLALNHRSLTRDGLTAFTAMLRLYALPDNAASQRQIDGIVDLAHTPSNAWLRHPQGSAYLNGIQIQVTLDEQAFAGSGIHVFGQLLDHFFGLYVHLNGFTQLVLLSSTSGKELLRCPARNGALTLA